MTRGHFFATILTALFGARFARWFGGPEIVNQNIDLNISAIDGESFRRLVDKKYSASIEVSDEMLADCGIDFEAYLRGQFVEAMRRQLWIPPGVM